MSVLLEPIRITKATLITKNTLKNESYLFDIVAWWGGRKEYHASTAFPVKPYWWICFEGNSILLRTFTLVLIYWFVAEHWLFFIFPHWKVFCCFGHALACNLPARLHLKYFQVVHFKSSSNSSWFYVISNFLSKSDAHSSF